MLSSVEHAELLGPLRLRYDELLTCSLQPNFTLSSDAWRYKIAFQQSSYWRSLLQSFPEHMEPSLHRLDSHIYRLATIYQASMSYPWHMEVSEEAMAFAIQFVCWCAESMRDALGILSSKDQTPQARVYTLIKASAPLGLPFDALLRESALPAKIVAEAINTLIAARQVIRVGQGPRMRLVPLDFGTLRDE
jgi:hypothetical protein